MVPDACSVKQAYFATSALAALGSLGSADKAGICGLAAKAGKVAGSNAEELFYATRTASTLRSAHNWIGAISYR